MTKAKETKSAIIKHKFKAGKKVSQLDMNGFLQALNAIPLDAEISTEARTLAEKVGLTVHKDTVTGATGFTQANGDNVTVQQVADTYYPTLDQKIIDQFTMDQYRGAHLFGGIFQMKEYINGVVEKIIVGTLVASNYDKTVTIDNWNPADPVILSNAYSVTDKEYVSIKLTNAVIITAFTSPARLFAFTQMLLKQLGRTFEIMFQTDQGLILANDVTAKISLNPDVTVDTTILSATDDILKDISERIQSYEVAGYNHLALNTTYATIPYSAKAADLMIIYNAPFKAIIENEVLAKYFGPNATVPSITSTTVDFKSIDGIGLVEAAKIKAILIDKKSLEMFFQVKNFDWNFRSPIIQEVYEKHNWKGYLRNPNYTIVEYRDVT